MDLHLTDRRVLITGGSKGIGAAIAGSFAAEGCLRIDIASRNAARLEETRALLADRYATEIRCHPTDLRQAADLERLAADCSDADILINNAGDIPQGSLDDVDGARWRHAWDLKVFGTIDLTRLLYERMKARGSGGVIVNIIGAAGERFPSSYITGASGNAALMGFTRALGGRSLDDGIRVVGINPGSVATDRGIERARTRAAATLGDPDRYPELLTRFPGGRMAEPAEVADVAVFLASPRASYVSGTIVTIDGGHEAGRPAQ